MSSNFTQATRTRLLVAGVFGVLTFSAYFATLLPSIYGGDSGELVAVVCRGGVAHPPGYPLYTVLAKAFTLLPLHSIAWRVNLMSAVAGTFAALILFFTIVEWTGSLLAGIAGAGMFAFSPSVWRFATVAEVFALNNLLIVSLLYLLSRYRNQKDSRLIYAGAFLTGLALANHHTSILYALPLGAFLFWSERAEWLRLDRIGKLLLFLCLGLLPYAYLPLAAREPKLVSWGNTGTFTGFLRHFLRSDYGTFQLTNGERRPLGPLQSLPVGLGRYLGRLPGETLYLGWILAAFGVWSFLHRKRERGILLVSLYLFGFYLFVFHSLANMPFDAPCKVETVSRFWQQPNILVFTWMGLGVAALLSMVPGQKGRRALSVVVLAVVLTQGARSFSRLDPDESRLYRQYGAAFIESLPKNSVLLILGDLPINTIRYVQECENLRGDVRVLNRSLLGKSWVRHFLERQYPDMTVPPLSDDMDIGMHPDLFYSKKFVDANRDKFPMFLNGNWEDEIPGGKDPEYQIWPHGLTDQIFPQKTAPDKKTGRKSCEAALVSFEQELPASLAEKYKSTPWGWMVQRDYWETRGRLGYRLIRYSSENGYDRDWLVDGARLIREDFKHVDPPHNPIFAKALGVAYTELTGRDASYAQSAVSAWKDYLSSVTDDADMGRIRAFIEKHK